jgi:hypothetical protein
MQRWIAPRSIYTPPRPRIAAFQSCWRERWWPWFPMSDKRMLPLKTYELRWKYYYLDKKSARAHHPWAWRRRLKLNQSGVGWG